MQAYLPARGAGRITIPQSAYAALGLRPDDWLRIRIIADGRALMERMPRKIADDPSPQKGGSP